MMRCYEDSGRVDLVRIELAGLDQDFDLGDRDPACGRHIGIEIACRLSVDEIALGVALPGLDQRHVRDEPVSST